MSERRDIYIDQMKAKLDKWSAKIDRFETRAAARGGAAKSEFQSRLAALREASADVKQKIDNVMAASEAVWPELRSAVQVSGKFLVTSVNSAFADLKQAAAPKE